MAQLDHASSIVWLYRELDLASCADSHDEAAAAQADVTLTLTNALVIALPARSASTLVMRE